jgi:hypothetical protein
MPNPVKAARKAGRQNLKDLKQNIRAEKITKKFEAKADKVGMKARAAGAAAKSAAQAKAGVTPSTVSKIEPLKKKLEIPTTPLKFELAKPSASAVAAKEAAFKPTPKPAPKAAAPKKKTTTKKKATTDKGPFKLPDETIWETVGAGKRPSPLRLTKFYDGAAEKEKKRIAKANEYLKKEQAEREANQKAEQERQNNPETRRLFRGPLTMTYRKKGGSTKSKKK